MKLFISLVCVLSVLRSFALPAAVADSNQDIATAEHAKAVAKKKIAQDLSNTRFALTRVQGAVLARTLFENNRDLICYRLAVLDQSRRKLGQTISNADKNVEAKLVSVGQGLYKGAWRDSFSGFCGETYEEKNVSTELIFPSTRLERGNAIALEKMLQELSSELDRIEWYLPKTKK